MELLTYEQLTPDNRLDAVKSQKAGAIFDYVKYYETWTIERNWIRDIDRGPTNNERL